MDTSGCGVVVHVDVKDGETSDVPPVILGDGKGATHVDGVRLDGRT